MRMLAAALACWLITAGASAQTARDEFVRGQQAASEQRWADALAHFRRSYELSPNPVALYDAATTLRLLGRYVEARDALAALLRDHEELAADLREGALELRADVEPRIARLVLTLPELDALAVRVDGRLRDPPEIELDPGEHALAVSAPGHVPFAWSGTLAAGAIERLVVTLEPERADLTVEHWTIGVIATVSSLAVIAAVIGASIGIHDAAQLAPRTDVVLAP